MKQTHDMQGLQMSYFNRNIHNNEINNWSKKLYLDLQPSVVATSSSISSQSFLLVPPQKFPGDPSTRFQDSSMSTVVPVDGR